MATVPGTDPDRTSYQIAVQTTEMLVAGARNAISEAADVVDDIGRAILACLNPPCRPRVCACRVKSRSAAEKCARPANPAHLPAGHQSDHRHQPVSGRKEGTPPTVIDPRRT